MTAKSDGSCLKPSWYYSFDLEVPRDWTPTAVDGEVAEFRFFSLEELEEEVRCGERLRPAMRSVLLDFLMRHGVITPESETDYEELQRALHCENPG